MSTETGRLSLSMNSPSARPVWFLLALSILTLAALWHQYRPSLINPDAAQLASTASNLIQGHGLKTSAIYYEEQLAQGSGPVEQTIWPPGFALLLVPLLLMGFSPAYAAFVLSALGVLASVLLVFRLCKAVGVSDGPAVVAATATLLFMPLTVLVLPSMSDSVYTAATLISALLLIRTSTSRKPMAMTIAVGLAATAAFLLRYIGVSWLAACGLTLIAMNYRLGWSELLRRSLAYGLIPAAVVGAVFYRNYLFTGSLTGGPSIGGESSLGAVGRTVYYSLTSLFGARTDPWQPITALLGGAVIAAITLWLLFQLRGRGLIVVSTQRSIQIVCLSLLYMTCTGGVLVSLAFVLYPDLPQARYFAPLIPFAGIAAAVCWSSLQSEGLRQKQRARAGWNIAAAVLCVAYVFGQFLVYRWHMNNFTHNPRVVLMQDVEQTSVKGTPLTLYLQQHVRAEASLLTADGQSLSLLLGIPVVSLPEPRYSLRVWSEDQVHTVVREQHVCFVLVHPPTLVYPEDRNRVFLRALKNRQPPAWLEVIAQTDRLQLYRVIDQRCKQE